MSKKFRSIIDRVVTDKDGNVIFTAENPGYVTDGKSTRHLETLVLQQADQINLLIEIVNRLQTQIDELNAKFNNQIFGLSSDTKPLDVNVGTTFFEIDTSNVYMYDGSSWVVI